MSLASENEGSVSDNNYLKGHANLHLNDLSFKHNHHHGDKNIDVDSKPLSDDDLTALFRYHNSPKLFAKTLRDISPDAAAGQTDAELEHMSGLFTRLVRAMKRARV